MKYLLKVLTLIMLISIALMACSGEDVSLPTPDARISVVVEHDIISVVKTPNQSIVVDANSDGYYRLRINIDNGDSNYNTRASLAIDSLNGNPISNGLLTEETINVQHGLDADLNLKLTPGAYTLILEGQPTEVKITVNPHGTTPSPTTAVAPA